MSNKLLFGSQQFNTSSSSSEKVVPIGSDPWLVLIVDDEPDVHAATKIALHDLVYKHRNIKLIFAFDSVEAKERLRKTPNIALAFIDVVMESESAGLDLVQWIRREQKIRDMRLILRTGQPGQAPEKQVICDYEINDYQEKSALSAKRLFSATVTGLRGYEDISLIETLLNNLGESQGATVNAVASLCESRDTHLGSHIQRVSVMSVAIAKQMQRRGASITDHFIQQLGPAAALHDTGKISISDGILNAPRALTVSERRIIETHCLEGFKALKQATPGHAMADDILPLAQRVAHSHHEHWNGNGYPLGLSGDRIPLESRIVAIADTFDALRAQRPYKPKMDMLHAMSIMESENASHFDPQIFEDFVRVVREVDRHFVYESFPEPTEE